MGKNYWSLGDLFVIVWVFFLPSSLHLFARCLAATGFADDSEWLALITARATVGSVGVLPMTFSRPSLLLSITERPSPQRCLLARFRLTTLAMTLVCLATCIPMAKGGGDEQRGQRDKEQHFESKVRPLLIQKCLPCHNEQKVSGGLRLDLRELMLKGGESGPAVVPGQAAQSLLLKAIRRSPDVSAMPPDEDKAVRPDEIQAIEAWIADGSVWPAADSVLKTAKLWSLEPVANVQVPAAGWGLNDIDSFIAQKFHERQLQPVPEADRFTLIRRLSYGLTGLPPSAEEVEAFLADTSPDAYDHVVDRLMASPQYGEHFGRKWLDVVRYADTAGENSDHPLPHAWRYRNWVIDAFNSNKRYDDFVRDQLAGDLIHKDQNTPEFAAGVTATGYLAIARRFGHDIDADMHLTMEDTIDTLGKSFLGLSLGCARCHDHKFDPISAKDYYALYGVFESTRFSFPGCEPKQQPRDLVPLIPPKELESSIAPIKAREEEVRAKIAALEKTLAENGDPLKSVATESVIHLAGGDIADGASARISGPANEPLSCEIQAGDLLVLTVAPGGNHGADSTRVELTIQDQALPQNVWSASDIIDQIANGNPCSTVNGGTWFFLNSAAGNSLLNEFVKGIDGQPSLEAWRQGDTPSVFVNRSSQPVKVWTELPARSFFVHPGQSGPVAVAWKSPVKAHVAMTGLIADAHPGADGIQWKLERIQNSDFQQKLEAASRSLVEIRNARQQLEHLELRATVPVAYAVAEGTPKNAREQLRGDPAVLGDEVARRVPSVFGDHSLSSTTESGRRELAEWIASPQNPLTVRVFVNRLWQWHFGRGLVATPNDFGTRGAQPSHPELLDFLADQFVRSGWDIKGLNRLIVKSAAYRQGSIPGSDPAAVWLAGYPRQRLTAEELRDSLLAVSGELDKTTGEAHPFPPEATWSFSQHGPFAAEYETNRRSVYVMQKRNRRTRFFALFDGADPNASTPVRDVTTVPTQALFFMNDPFVTRSAGKLGTEVLVVPGDDKDRLHWLTRRIFGRSATDEEMHELNSFQAEPGSLDAAFWSSMARVMLSSNEFLYVD